MTKSVVTGGAGFVGSNLARHLLTAGHEVTVVDNLSTGRLENVADVLNEVRFVEVDVRNRESLEEAFSGADYVFHQAALGSVPRSIDDPWTSHDNNVNGTLTVLLAAQKAGVRRVIYAASSSAYGDTPTLPKVETMRSLPLSPYAVTKLVGELYFNVFYRVYGLETVALRYFNIFGPRQNPHTQYSAVIPKFITAALKGEPVTVHGDGNQSRDFTYIDNVVEANLRAALAPAEQVAGETFNLGCNDRISLNRILGRLEEILDRPIARVHVDTRKGDVRDSLADISKAQAAFSYEVRVPFPEGLRRTVAWYQQNG